MSQAALAAKHEGRTELPAPPPGLRLREIFAWRLDARRSLSPIIEESLAALADGTALTRPWPGSSQDGPVRASISRLGLLVVESEAGAEPRAGAQQAQGVAAELIGPLEACPPDAHFILAHATPSNGANAQARHVLAGEALAWLGAEGQSQRFLSDQVFVAESEGQPLRAVVVGDSRQFRRLLPGLELALLQRARLTAVDVELAAFRRQAEADLRHVSATHWSTVRDARRLEATNERLKRLLLQREVDRGPLTNPRRYLPDRDATRLYEALAEAFELEDWVEEQDDLAEVVEDIYESITEKLAEYRNVLFEAVLEVIIIVVLFIELVVLLVDLDPFSIFG